MIIGHIIITRRKTARDNAVSRGTVIIIDNIIEMILCIISVDAIGVIGTIDVDMDVIGVIGTIVVGAIGMIGGMTIIIGIKDLIIIGMIGILIIIGIIDTNILGTILGTIDIITMDIMLECKRYFNFFYNIVLQRIVYTAR